MLVGWLMSVAAQAAPVAVGPDVRELDLSSRVDFLVDPAGELDLAALRSGLTQKRFRPARGPGALNLGFSSGATYWMRVRLSVRAEAAPKQYLLAVPYAPLDEVTLYSSAPNGAWQRQRAGDRVPRAEQPLATRYPVFPLRLEAGEHTLYLQVRTTSSVQLPLTLWRESAYAVAVAHQGLAFGVYYGVMLAMMLYNLLVFVSIRDRLYLYYVLAVVTTLAFSLCLNGYGPLYLWYESPDWNNRVLATTMTLGVLVAVYFSRAFLRIEHHLPRIDRLLRIALAALVGSVLIASVAPYGIGVRLGAAMVVVAIPLVFLAGLLCWRRGVDQAGYFVLAWLALLIGAVTHAFKAYGLIPATDFTHYSMQIGSALEFVLLAFALADRLRTFKDATARAQRAANERLEQRVDERTRELNSALEQLQGAYRLLQENARLDGLTGIHNREYFEERYEAEWRRARREGSRLALLMIDIDHFKQVNDEHGHLVGDTVLPVVAKTLYDQLGRASDTLARYGGEEFVALLGGAERAGVAQVAERMRAAVAATTVECDGLELRVTVSIGFYVFTPSGRAEERAEALARADAALYAAKTYGRNRVVDSATLEQS